ncbi:uncharacterized protein BDCG_16169 [Blastomyces dermatitidis ER-3]|uniref:Uncharacterized protein n=1 Tax=Ajellomyces dermatitidis (strain ER-3 / ATCC MYA-2586) TaxID=559297 RepID=A0ABX2VQH2_AJEDR|nr:uncharacterized protein BDCG_16169 [Blastomyces dermatitidis ER-3]OAS99499.1 hypothetical protein BDCG_16169 [Blastomyces dermatitidis ER-3]
MHENTSYAVNASITSIAIHGRLGMDGSGTQSTVSSLLERRPPWSILERDRNWPRTEKRASLDSATVPRNRQNPSAEKRVN